MAFGFNLLNPKHPRKRYVYAVTTGAFVGELLVYMEDAGEEHSFLSLPDMRIRTIPKDKFILGIKEHIVDIVEMLPNDVYKICIAQYKKNKQGK